MTSTAGSGPRQRLLDTLSTLSARHNVLDIGINLLLSEARVAKASLYSHFGSKDDLVLVWLDERQQQWFGWFHAYLAEHAREGDPASELDAAFGFLESWLGRSDFSGCPFLSVGLQVQDQAHPVARQARSYAEQLLEFFRTRLVRLDARHPVQTATALLELYLGAVTLRQMSAARAPAQAARRMAQVLMAGSLAQEPE